MLFYRIGESFEMKEDKLWKFVFVSDLTSLSVASLQKFVSRSLLECRKFKVKQAEYNILINACHLQ